MLTPYKYEETEPYEKGFANYYEQNIVPLAQKFEPIRKKKKIQHIGNITFALLSGLGSSWLIAKSTWFLQSRARKKGNILILPPMLSWWLCVKTPQIKYFNSVKKEITPLILEFMGSFEYSVYEKLDTSLFKLHLGYQFFLKKYKCEDVISYEKNGFKCKIIEKTFWDIFGTTGKVFILLEANHTFPVDAVIENNNRHKEDKKRLRSLVKKRNLNNKPTALNSDFDENFLLYLSETNNNIEWISDSFIKELTLLNQVFDQQGLIFSIKDKQIFVELESKSNLFETGYSYSPPAVNAIDIKRLLKELDFVIKLADILSERAIKLRKQEKQ